MLRQHQQKKVLQSTTLRSGLALVFIPCVIGVATFCTLAETWQESDRVLRAESQDMDVNLHLIQAIDIWDGLSESQFWQMFDAPIATQRPAESFLRSVHNQLQEALVKAGPNTEAALFINHIYAMVAKEQTLHKYIEQNKVTLDEKGKIDWFSPLQLMQHGKSLLEATSRLSALKREELSALIDERSRLSTLQHTREQQMQFFQTAVLALLLLNVASTFVIANTIAAKLSNRMHLLAESSENFSKQRFNIGLIAGQDEFALVQSMLRDSFEKVQSANEHRETVTSMIAHDLRAPLMSARANLHLLEEYADGLTESAVSILLSIHEQLDQVLNVADDVTSSSVPALLMAPSLESPPSEKSKSLRTTYFQQLIFITFLPLVIQLIFLSAILLQTRQAVSISNQARHQIEISQERNLAVTSFILATSNEIRFLLSEKNTYDANAKSQFEEATNHIRTLSHLVIHDNNDAREYVRLFSNEFAHLKATILGPSSTSHPLRESATRLKRLGESHDSSAIAARSRALEQIWRETNVKQIDAASARLQSTFESISRLIFIGLGIFISAEIALLLLFIYTIRKDVKLLTLMANQVGTTQFHNLELGRTATFELVVVSNQLNAVNQRIVQASQQRSQILKFLSADLRAPLLQILSEEKALQASITGLSEKCTTCLKRSHTSVEQVVDILEDLLTIDSVEAGTIDLRYGTIDMKELLSTCITNVAALAAKKMIEFDLQCEPASIDGDERRLKRVVLNLLTNAVKFSPEKTTIDLAGKVIDQQFQIAVKDQGIGIKSEDLGRVFETRYQAQSSEVSTSGYGLGLAICKLIVDAHGGNVHASSTLGQGSTFTVTVPLHEPTNSV